MSNSLRRHDLFDSPYCHCVRLLYDDPEIDLIKMGLDGVDPRQQEEAKEKSPMTRWNSVSISNKARCYVQRVVEHR